MIIDGITELDDCQFAADSVNLAREMPSFWKLEECCLQGDIETRIDVCVAATDLCGGDYSSIEDIDRGWGRALNDLRGLHSRLRSEARNGLPLEHVNIAWQQADGEFAERFHAAIARWDERIAADNELDSGVMHMATTTKTAKRSRPKSAAQTTTKEIILRIEKRLKFGGSIYVTELEPGDWTFATNVRDSKLSELIEVNFGIVGCYADEQEAIREAFKFVGQGIDDIHEANHGHASRLASVKSQLQEQCQQIIGDGIPETQIDAAAKEAAASPAIMVPNNRPAWKCSCGAFNDLELVVCGSCSRLHTNHLLQDTGEKSLKWVPLKDISPSPLNPRQTFDEKALRELAESIQNHGLLQPIVIYPVGGRETYYEIIAGERRFRASQMSNASTVILARILNCTEQEAIELRVIENLKREDLNAIEEAQGFQQMIDKCGYSQRDLAARLGVSQGHVGNRLGLLKLPEIWIQRLVSGEIVPTQAREIAPWADSAAFMKELEEWYSETHPEGRIHDWSDTVKEIPWTISKPLKGRFYDHETMMVVEACLSKKDLEHPDLDIRELPARYGRGDPERRAFNLELWNQFQAAGLARKTKAASKKLNRDDSEESSSSKNNRSPEDEKRLREQQAKAWQKKLYRHKIAWIQRAVIAKLDPCVNFPGKANLLLKLLLHFSTIHERRGRADEMKEVLKGAGLRGELLALDSDQIALQALPIVLRWLADTFEGYQVHIRPEQFEQLAAELEIDFDSEYRVERELLELAPKAKLQTWAAEWGGSCYSEKRFELVDQLAIDVVGKEDAPKELLKVKPISLH